MRLSTMILATALSGAVACSGGDGARGDASQTETIDTAMQALGSHARANVQRTFMTRNVFLGAAIEPVMAAGSPEEVPLLVATAWAQLQANDFSARAAALAKEIDESRPEAVGLQEIGLFRRFPADGSAVQELDYLSMLQAALAARGAPYVVAVVQKDTDVFVPLFAGLDQGGAPILDGLQLVDRDAILVRADVPFTQPMAARFTQGLPVEVGGAPIEIVRGWASVVIPTSQGSFRFFTTHLEDAVPEVQVAQAAELVTLLQAESLPMVVTGDLNSRADGSTTPSYAMIAGTGLVDVWAQARPRDPGYTCCRSDDLSKTDPLYERIDVIFATPSSCRGNDRLRGPVSAKIVGEEPRDRTASGLWPSDHAGVVARFVMPFVHAK